LRRLLVRRTISGLLELITMPEQEVRSPVCRPGSKVGSGQPLSPGARSSPSRACADSVPEQKQQVASPVRSHSNKGPERRGGEDCRT
jgi:hypothetical protein